MNYTEVNQTGGFPLETDTLQALQSAYSIFNALGELAGNYAIISGCTTLGSMVSDGVVYINGEVLNFKGSTKGTYVIIKEDTSERLFEDGQSKIVYKNRYATFGSSTTKYAWTAFKPIKNVLTLDAEKESKAVVNELAKKVVPKGVITLWSGVTTAIPTGWFLCDGSNGTPDLRNRFVVGAGSTYNVGATGGADTVALTEAQMPKHNHTGTTNSTGSHKHTGSTNVAGNHNHSGTALGPYSGTYVGGGFSGNSKNPFYRQPIIINSAGAHSHTLNMNYAGAHAHTLTTNTKGSSQAHENRPPYYALAYIMFKG